MVQKTFATWPTPVMNFSVDCSGPLGMEIEFGHGNSLNQDGVTSFSWDFGSGATPIGNPSTGFDERVGYYNQGPKTITLTLKKDDYHIVKETVTIQLCQSFSTCTYNCITKHEVQLYLDQAKTTGPNAEERFFTHKYIYLQSYANEMTAIAIAAGSQGAGGGGGGGCPYVFCNGGGGGGGSSGFEGEVNTVTLPYTPTDFWVRTGHSLDESNGGAAGGTGDGGDGGHGTYGGCNRWDSDTFITPALGAPSYVYSYCRPINSPGEGGHQAVGGDGGVTDPPANNGSDGECCVSGNGGTGGAQSPAPLAAYPNFGYGGKGGTGGKGASGGWGSPNEPATGGDKGSQGGHGALIIQYPLSP